MSRGSDLYSILTQKKLFPLKSQKKKSQQSEISMSIYIAKKSATQVANEFLAQLLDYQFLLSLLVQLSAYQVFFRRQSISIQCPFAGLTKEKIVFDHYNEIRSIFKAFQQISEQRNQPSMPNSSYQLQEILIKVFKIVLKSWYASMSNKKNLQLLNYQYYIINLTSKQFKYLTRFRKNKFPKKIKKSTYNSQQLNLLNKLNDSNVEYRGSLINQKLETINNPKLASTGNFTQQFNQFKAKSIFQAQQDLNSIAIL